MSQLEKPAFLIGVTGHIDLRDEEVGPLKERVKALFRLLLPEANSAQRRESLEGFVKMLPPADAEGRAQNEPNPYSQALQRWPTLEQTPIILLTSLAPGADSLCAEVALENEFKERIRIVAPLPFPQDVYEQATTFVAKSLDGSPDPDDGRLRENYRRLVDVIGAENTFAVRLAEDRELSADEFMARCRADLDDSERRRMRYYAAGEYMAAYAHLLLAIWDDQHDTKTTGSGAAAVVHARRNGVRAHILPASTGLNQPHGGPVVHLHTHRQSNPEPRKDVPLMRFLHPYASAPSAGAKDDNSLWQRTSLSLFCRIAGNLEAFNREKEPPLDRVTAELDTRLRCDATGESPARFSCRLEQRYPGFHHEVRRMAALRRKAADATVVLDKSGTKTLAGLFWLSLAAAVFLHLFAEWHQPIEAQDGGAGLSWLRPLFGLIAVIAALSGLWLYWKRRPLGLDERAHDCRALAEGLRVQFYWNLAGLGTSVPAHYMQRQRSELDWVRGAIRAASFPYERWRELFEKMDKPDQITALRCVLVGWVKEQRKYFKDSRDKHHRKVHLWHKRGSLMALAGLWLVAFLTLCTLVARHGEPDWLTKYAWFGVILVAALAYWTWRLRKCNDGEDDQKPSASPGTWSQAILARIDSAIELVVPTSDPHSFAAEDAQTSSQRMWRNFLAYLPCSATLAAVVVTLCSLVSKLHGVPGALELNLIAAGCLLVSGALAIAWSEKKLNSELAYQYSTMAALFVYADGRLEGQIKALEEHGAGTPEYSKTLHEIRELLCGLGVEALDENAEWLILHRARPLEPVMTG